MYGLLNGKVFSKKKELSLLLAKVAVKKTT